MIKTKEIVMKDIDDSLNSDIHKPEDEAEKEVNEDNPEWDGTESELVADDDAEEYEIPETGIKLSYVMTQKEMYRCLYNSDMYKTKGIRAVFSTVVFALASAGFLAAYFNTSGQFKDYNLFFSIFCAVMIAVVWAVPYFHIKSMAKIAANGKKIEAEIYPDHIDIGSGSCAWSIDLDGNCELSEFDNIFMISIKDKNFAIPERVIEPEVYNEVKAILVSGTRPKEN